MSARSAASRPFGLSNLPSVPRPSLRVLLAALLALAGLLGGWLLLRDSSLVRVQRVTIVGARGFGSAAVRASLTDAARDMTTLNVDRAALVEAARRFPIVAGIDVHAAPPHGLRIVVHERRAVGVIAAGTQQVVVAQDGTLLPANPADGLPLISARSLPAGPRVLDPGTRAKVLVLAATPQALRARVQRVGLGPHGVVVRLDKGPELRFGSGARPLAKWIAVTRVLFDPQSAGATYIDVRVPERAAAGGLTLAQGGAPQSIADPAASAPVVPVTPLATGAAGATAAPATTAAAGTP